MKMSSVSITVGLAAIFAAITMAVAQAPRSGETEAPQMQEKGQMGGMMNMMQMMQECHRHCQEVRKTSTETLPQLREARESNDVSELQAGLDQAIEALEASSAHMEQCMAMMMGDEGNQERGDMMQQQNRGRMMEREDRQR